MAKRKFSMAELFNGRVHVLTKGADFKDSDKFRKSLYRNWARLRTHARKRLKTRFDGKLLTIQIIPRMSKSTCRVCGRKFIPTIKNRCYCGPACAKRRPKWAKPGKTALAVVKLWNSGLAQTSIHYELGVSRQRVAQLLRRHSDELNVPIKDRREPVARTIRYCAVCGKELDPAISSRKYCSKTCRRKAVIARGAPWSRVASVKLKCEACGRRFTRSHYLQKISEIGGSQHVYCSKDCYWTRKRRRKR
jgi:hypothetical protein